MQKTLVIQVAALGHDFLVRQSGGTSLDGLEFSPIESVCPAVTCAVQATMRTAAPPALHGMVGNGFYSREFARPFFWEQSSNLVTGERIWEGFRRSGGRVGSLFWQQSLGTDADVILSPAPIHKHHGGMIQDCFSRPAGLYARLAREIGGFDLSSYWGPRASVKSTRWIARATSLVMRDPAPELLLTYLPHLDYDLQRFGPESPRAAKAFAETAAFVEELVAEAHATGYAVLVFGDYAIVPVAHAALPNLRLLEEGLMSARHVKGMLYSDLHTSRAFAVCDHQIAHVIVRDKADIGPVRDALAGLPGVASVLDEEGKREVGINHPRSGDLVLLSRPDAWFAYQWWRGSREAPDYATHVDIHNKPSYDPCELFWGRWPFSVSTDPGLVKGSHGLVEGCPATWAANFGIRPEGGGLLGLSSALRTHLEKST